MLTNQKDVRYIKPYESAKPWHILPDTSQGISQITTNQDPARLAHCI
jgi:hypothetical protein